MVGVGEGAYGPSANTLLCAAAPPEKRGRALGIYNVGMAFGATSGLVLGNVLASTMGWHYVFWIAGGPSILLAVSAAFVAAPARLAAPDEAARARLPAGADLPDRARGRHPVDLRRQRAGRLVPVSSSSRSATSRIAVGSVFMAAVGLVCGIGGVVAGGYLGDALNRRGGAAATRARSGCR